MHRIWFACILLPGSVGIASGSERILDPDLHHLRIEGPREWSDFPESAEAPSLELTFPAEANANEHLLRLRQQDVKQNWRVRMNDNEIGRLTQDEADMVIYLQIPPGTLVTGENRLRIEQDRGPRSAPDDILVGEIALDTRSVNEALSESKIDVAVTSGTGDAVPCRITVTNVDGALQSMSFEPDARLAIRTGVAYTAGGLARLRLPPGRYTICASRGFEWSVASKTLSLDAGDTASLPLTIRREVPTAGWIASDPHIHTFTHSGHGDATIEERMVTIAGEGIELPIATDHNVQIDYEPSARQVDVRRYFTPVVGNEFTTRSGHFNLFPVEPAGTPPDRALRDWPAIFEAIGRTNAQIVILNHGRDVHSGFRPFDPEHFNAAAGTRLDGRPIGFNAMEVVNSGATQTDITRLFLDWMALLNAGHDVVPIGSSDSHDVARYVVGQGRTYVRGDDSDPASIDIPAAIENIRAGRVRVSYGLLTELNVAGSSSGELVAADDDPLRVDVRVLGPSWTAADRVELYMNGAKIREQAIDSGKTPGLKWTGGWAIPKPGHDVHLVAIASGPGVDAPHWQTRKPYQPTSPDWTPRLIGCSGTVWIDADGDGRKSSACEYAQRLYERSGGSESGLFAAIADYDEAVAIQVAHLYQVNGGSLTSPKLRELLRKASPATRAGFQSYFEAWRDGQAARSGSAN